MPKTFAVARSAAVYFLVRLSKPLPIFSPPSLLFPPPVCPSLSLSVVLPSFGCPSSPSLLGGERGDPLAPLPKRRSTVVAGGGGIQKAPSSSPFAAAVIYRSGREKDPSVPPRWVLVYVRTRGRRR